MVTLCLCLLAAGNCLEYANHQGGNHSPRPQESSVADNHHHHHQEKHQDQDGEAHSHTPMQGFSPLHIPQFSGSMNYASGLSLAAQSGTSTSNLSKARGASDCPGVCPLCGAMLRQARNLRRHLLSSCKYRFSNNSSQNSVGDPAMMVEVKSEIKSEVEMSGYNDQSVTYGTDSGSNSCEQIVCKPTLPSPTTHDDPPVLSPHSSIPSPTIAR